MVVGWLIAAAAEDLNVFPERRLVKGGCFPAAKESINMFGPWPLEQVPDQWRDGWKELEGATESGGFF